MFLPSSISIARLCSAPLVYLQGWNLVDRPVNGGPGAATAGALRMMVGGEADVLDQARLVLEAFTSRIYPMGPNGTGTLMNAGQL